MIANAALRFQCLFMHAADVLQVGASCTLSHSVPRTLSQAFSGGLPSPAHALSISAAPAGVIQMSLLGTSAALTQPAASTASAGSMPPAVAAQHAHLGSDADSHPAPSPNYRMDHVLADSLHGGMHVSHDFGPLSLVSAMSNDENLTPAVSRDFSQAARMADQQEDVPQEDATEVNQKRWLSCALHVSQMDACLSCIDLIVHSVEL